MSLRAYFVHPSGECGGFAVIAQNRNKAKSLGFREMCGFYHTYEYADMRATLIRNVPEEVISRLGEGVVEPDEHEEHYQYFYDVGASCGWE